MKKVKKRIGSFLLVLCLFVSAICPAAVFGQEGGADISTFSTTYTYGDFSYTVSDDEVTISGYSGSDEEVEIPSQIDSMPVTKIGSNAFKGNTAVKSVVLPEQLTRIETYAFYNCTALETVEFPETLTYISNYAFYKCTSLTEVELYDNVAYIASYAFYDCESLASVTLSAGMSIINSYTFQDCTALEQIVIPDAVTSIDKYAFKGCTGLSSVTLPDALTSIGVCAFMNCTSLTQITFPDGLTEIGASAFYSCTKLKNVTFPDSLESIGNAAFYKCTRFTEVVLGDNITSLGYTVFKYCTNLTTAVLSSGMTVLDDNTFAYCTSLTDVEIPEGIVQIGDYAFAYCEALTEISLPESVTSIDSYAFYYCSALETVAMYNNVKSLGEYAFAYCFSLRDITLSDKITAIEQNTFELCMSLTELDLPESLISIASNAFLDCADPESKIKLFIYENCTSISSSAFGREMGFASCAVIYGFSGTYAETFASTYGVSFVYLDQEQGRSLSLTVFGADGEEITEGFSVLWYRDGEKSSIAEGTAVSGLVEDQVYCYEIVLESTLLEEFYTPERQSVDADVSGSISFALSEIQELELKGIVTDASGDPLSGAVVSVVSKNESQTIGGTIKVTTDSEGAFAAAVPAVYTKATIAAGGYYSCVKQISQTAAQTAAAGGGTYDLGTISLTSLASAGIDITASLTQACAAGTAAVTTALTSLGGLQISLLKNGEEFTSYEVQDMKLVFYPDSVSEGDVMTITVSGDSIAQASADVTLDASGTGAVQLELVENGSFKLGTVSGADSAYLTVFDEAGEYVDAWDVSGQKQSDPLRAGTYTLIFMEKNDVLRTVRTQESFEAYGLKENKDYVKLTVVIEDGTIVMVEDVEVPELRDDAFSYLNTEGTSVSVTKTEVAEGGYFVLRIAYSLDESYETSAQTMKVTLPDGIEATGNSSGSGAQYISSMSGDVLTISVDKAEAVVYQYCQAVSAGEYTISAEISFDLAGNEITLPLGGVSVSVAEATLSVSAVSGEDKLYTASGTAFPNGAVQVYDNDILVGETTANAAGSWSTKITLAGNCSNCSYHFIYAVSTDPDEEHTIETAEKMLIYYADENLPVLSSITLLYGSKSYVFDYTESSSSVPFFSYSSSSFTFKAEFSGDNSLLADVAIVLADQYGSITYVDTIYDETGGTWVGSVSFSSVSEVPVQIGAVYTYADDIADAADVISEDRLIEMTADYANTVSETADSVTDAWNITQSGSDDESDADIIWEIESQTEDSIKIALRLEEDDDPFGWYAIHITDDTRTADELYEDGYTAMDEGNTEFGLLSGDVEEYVDVTAGKRVTAEWIYEEEDTEVLLSTLSLSDLITSVTDSITESAYTLEKFSMWTNFIYSEVSSLIPDAVTDALFSKLKYSSLAASMTYDISNALAAGILAGSEYWTQIRGNQEVMADKLEMLTDLVDIRCADGSYALSEETRSDAYAEIEQIASILATYTDTARELNFEYMMSEVNRSLANAILAQVQDIWKDSMGSKNYGILSRFLLLVTADSSDGYAAEAEWTSTGQIFGDTYGETGENLSYLYELVRGPVFQLAGSGGIDNYVNGTYVLLMDWMEDISARLRSGTDCSGSDDDNSSDDDSDGSTGSSDEGTVDDSGLELLSYTVETTMRSIGVIYDPSGVVYEAVPSNTLDGVTATIWYEDEDGDAVQWNAEDYDQVNPQTTGEDGVYYWDVPLGNWMVTFSKEGYENADTTAHTASVDGWLPVTPPQYDINIAMVSTEAPEVSRTVVYTDRAEITFSQYMNIESAAQGLTLTTEDGTAVAVTVEALDAEYDEAGEHQYATRFALVPEDGSLYDTYYVRADTDVVNYAGTALEEAYTSEELTGGVRPESISMRDEVSVVMQEELSVNLTLLPGAAGKTLEVESLNTEIVEVVTDTVTTDEDGNAAVQIKGLLPGLASIQITEPESGVTHTVEVYVTMEEPDAVEDVVLTLEDGTEVADGMVLPSGTALYLSCGTSEATIKYTLDSTCPCRSGAFTYSGDITLTADESTQVELRAAALLNGVFSEIGIWTLTVVPVSDILDAELMLDCTEFIYSGQENKPGVTVVSGGELLVEGTDYTLEYADNIDAGYGVVTVTGIGLYSGTLTASFEIIAKDISGAEVVLDAAEYTYSGSACTPSIKSVTLEDGTVLGEADYTVDWPSGRKDAGTYMVTVTGTGNYTGTAGADFTIKAQTLLSSNVSLSGTSFTFNGDTQTPSVSVKNSNGTELTNGTDYTLTYSSGCRNAGTYEVTIEGMGNYSGTVTKTFEIEAKDISRDAAVTLSQTSFIYNGKSRLPSVRVTVTLDGSAQTLVLNTDCKVSCSSDSRKIGRHTVTITGTGNYTGTVTKTYSIIPAAAKIRKVKSVSSKKATVKWKKLSGGVTKYQVRYRVKGKKKWKTKSVSGSKQKTTLAGLKSGKTYQIQIRAYKKVDGVKYYGGWSSAKKVKVK